MSPELQQSIDQTLEALVAGLQSILGPRLVGVYLGGSLVMGDFCDQCSDVDFLVVTDGPLSAEDSLALEQLHQEMRHRYPQAARLQGDYAPWQLLIPEGTSAPVPGCEMGRFLPRVGEIMLSADNIYNIREQGRAVFGPEPRAVLPEVSRAQVRAAVREMMVDAPVVCETPTETADALLNLLRSAYAVETGLPSSKTSGAHWAVAHLSPDWHPAVAAALTIRCRQGSHEHEQLVRTALPALNEILLKQYC